MGIPSNQIMRAATGKEMERLFNPKEALSGPRTWPTAHLAMKGKLLTKEE
jgi:hypothetical protein